MKLANRLYLSFIPVILIIGLWSVVYSWYSYKEGVNNYIETARGVDIDELRKLSRDPLFAYYFDNIEKGYLVDASRDADDIKRLFKGVIGSSVRDDRVPVRFIFYDSAMKPLVNVFNAEDFSPDMEEGRNASGKLHLCQGIADCSKPYSSLVGNRHESIIPLWVQSSNGKGRQIAGYLYSRYALTLDRYLEDALSSMKVELKMMGFQTLLLTMLLFFLGRSITRPISQFAARVKRIPMEQGSRFSTVDSGIYELDILGSSLVKMQDEMQVKQEKLIAARDEAMSAVRAKSVFLSHMSHELRTPMNSVLGLSGLLEKTALDDRQKNYLDNIATSGKILLAVINDILDYSKIEEGKVEIERVPFSLKGMMQDISDVFSVRVGRKAITLKVSEIAQVIELAVGDPLHLRQVLINLVDNAIKFTPKGVITVDVHCESQSAQGYAVRFSVKDEGIGIPSESREELFDAFVQAGNSTTREYGGTGLGLAISSRLVSLMGGRLDFASEEGVGTEFFFTIVLKPASEDDLPARVDGWGSDTARQASSFKILIAEDNKINQLFIRETMKGLGFTNIEIVNDGVQAIERLKQTGYDLVLMDCQMPVMDGFSATRELRLIEKAAGKGQHTPVIAITAYAMAEDRQRCMDAGMDDHLSKPIDVKVFKAKMARWLNIAVSRPVKAEAAGEVVLNGPSECLARHFNESDLASLRQRISQPGWRDILLQFIRQLPQDVEGIEQAFHSQDAKALGDAAHSMRGAVSIFRARILIAICDQLQPAAKTGGMDGQKEMEGTQKIIAELRKETESLSQALLLELT